MRFVFGVGGSIFLLLGIGTLILAFAVADSSAGGIWSFVWGLAYIVVGVLWIKKASE
jgi:hypothetical protein